MHIGLSTCRGTDSEEQGWHLWPVLPLVLTSEDWACRSSLAFTSFLPRVGQLREIEDVWSAGGQGLMSLKAGGPESSCHA